MKINYTQASNFLADFMLESRTNKIEKILNLRTRHITLVLEDIYHPQNASAIIRTAECFGIQDIHIIEKNKTYTPNTDIVRGASKWISFYKYNSNEIKINPTQQCINNLKSKGYSIATTTLHSKDTSLIGDIDISKPWAICLGTEETGVSNTLINNADCLIKLPMYGFTESFNVSTAAALLLEIISTKLRLSNINWQLKENEKEILRFEWYKKSVKNSNKLLDNFFHKNL
jgi:tRNA (guanosine-2'-O-)-methyltransferase